ncbi:TetR family transcriptional regulator [uncultured Roseibium sp.]|uniref:TetR family transcriptional regulator n=1 Tax=uncultured Roseibium sp. TaxID=1936171 RepID=UPI003216AFB3
MRKTPEEAERTRQSILDAAELLFLESGIAHTSLERISRAAGVTRGAFYWHFKDKSELIRALQERADPPQAEMLRVAADEPHADPLQLLETATQEFLQEFESNIHLQHMIEIMSSNPHVGEDTAPFAEENKEMLEVLSKITRRAEDLGQLNPEFTPLEAAIALMTMVNGLLSEWLRSNKCFKLQELGTKLIRYQIKALKVAPT